MSPPMPTQDEDTEKMSLHIPTQDDNTTRMSPLTIPTPGEDTARMSPPPIPTQDEDTARMSPPPIPTQDKDTARMSPPIPTQDENTARMSPRIFPPNEDQDTAMCLPSSGYCKVFSPIMMMLQLVFLLVMDTGMCSPPPTEYCDVIFSTIRQRMLWQCVLSQSQQAAEKAAMTKKVDQHPLPSPEAEQVTQKVVEPAKELPHVLHDPGGDVVHDGPAVSEVVEEPHHPPEVQVYLSLHGGDMCDEQVSVNDDQGGNFECFSPRSFLPQQLLPSISCLDKPTHPTPAQHLYLSPAMLHHLLHITQPPLPKVRATPPPQAVLTQTVRVHLLGCAEEC